MGVVGYIFWKASQEESGEYLKLQEQIKKDNEANGTTWTFP